MRARRRARGRARGRTPLPERRPRLAFLFAALPVTLITMLVLSAPLLYQTDRAIDPIFEDRVDSPVVEPIGRPVAPEENRALRACAGFEGDALVVESEHDDTIPHAVITNYLAAFRRARSVTYRRIEGADHGLSDRASQEAYAALLMAWATEMVLGARGGRGRCCMDPAGGAAGRA
ncbi:MAG: hypothetical protein AVDCRST_MAG88-175, partial [uncultured Thermomicrobiales bacterium]